MAIEAPFSRYKRNNMLIISAMLLVAGAWFYYDGYKNAGFIEKHTNADQTLDSTLKFNRVSWPFFIAAGVLVGARFFMVRNRKVVADEQQLVVDKTVIPYAVIESINKTYFEKKGYFTITYKGNGQDKEVTLSDRTYDNLGAVLDHTVSKIK